MKNWVKILIGIELNRKIAFGKMAITTILILPIHDHGRCFHLLRSLISFFRDLKFLSYRSFTFLFRITPMYFVFFDYCEGCCFPNFILSLFKLCVGKGHWFVKLILFTAIALTLFIMFRSSLVRFFSQLYLLLYHLEIVIFWLLPFQFESPWPPLVVELLCLGLWVLYWIGR